MNCYGQQKGRDVTDRPTLKALDSGVEGLSGVQPDRVDVLNQVH